MRFAPILLWLMACGTVSNEPDGGVDGAGPAVDGDPAVDGAEDVDASPCGDCGAPTCVVQGECAYEDDPVCDETGTVVETCVPRVCVDLECQDGTPFDRTVECVRETDTTMCGADVCTDSGSCAFEGNATCDTTGTKPQTCVPKVCVAGACADGTAFSRVVACTRPSTDGTTCATTTCTDTSSCSFEGGACDESGTKTQSCVPHTCRGDACADEAAFTRTVSCSRVSDGDVCGLTAAGCPGDLVRELCCSATGACSVSCGPCS